MRPTHVQRRNDSLAGERAPPTLDPMNALLEPEPLPTSTCTYEVFDPSTLLPANDTTCTRLLELGWTRETFAGRRVLDIGANTGMLSIHALAMGAASVLATDVQVPLVEFLDGVARRHGLPIEVRRAGFFDLQPARDGADIVLLMEVLHWLVDQGADLDAAVAHAAALTRQTLYLETPWDVREPSIAHKGIVSAERYNFERILRALKRHFHSVEVVRFMTYFGEMKGSKRVLLRASDPHDPALPLEHLGDANLVDLPMVHGQHRTELVTTPRGPRLLKRLPARCSLAELDDESAEALCGHLAALRDPVLVPPESWGGRFRHAGSGGDRFMRFPFVGRLSDYVPERRGPAPVQDPLTVALALRGDLRATAPAIVDAVRAVCLPVEVPDVGSLSGRTAAALWTSPDVGPVWRAAAAALRGYDRRREDTLIHSDLQGGNMLIDARGLPRVVDLDLLRTGSVYADLLSCAIFNGVARDALEAAVDTQARAERRPPDAFDLHFAFAQTLGWFRARSAIDPPTPQRQIDCFVDGLRAVAAWAAAYSIAA